MNRHFAEKEIQMVLKSMKALFTTIKVKIKLH